MNIKNLTQELTTFARVEGAMMERRIIMERVHQLAKRYPLAATVLLELGNYLLERQRSEATFAKELIAAGKGDQ